MVVPPVRPCLGEYMFVQKRAPPLHNIIVVLERTQMVVPPVRPCLGEYTFVQKRAPLLHNIIAVLERT